MKRIPKNNSKSNHRRVNKKAAAQSQNNGGSQARSQALLNVTSDLIAIHETLNEITSSPHSHDIIELSLAASLSDLLSTEALLWLLIVGPPSSDKTETALALKDAPHVFHLDTLTENAFISGYISPDGRSPQDLLAILDGRCLTIKDLNALFGLHPDKVAKVLGDLTAIYDGEFAKWTGTRGDVRYDARFSLIGCVTPFTLTRHHRYMDMIGARFLRYRVAELRQEEVDDGFKNIWTERARSKARLRELASAYATQLRHKVSQAGLVSPAFGDAAKEQLNGLAKFLAHARAAIRTEPTKIETDSGKTATVYDIVEVQREEPFRALLQLRVLALALALVHQREEVTEHEIELCRRVVLSSMPYDRSQILALFQDSSRLTQDGGLTRKAAAEGIGKARNQAVRLLTELESIEVLTGVKTHDDVLGVDVWTYYPASDEFAGILNLPTKTLDHIGDAKGSPPQGVVLCQPTLTQNYVQGDEESSEPSEDDKQESDVSQGATIISMPFMITKGMKQQLADLGYSTSQINQMTPDQAHRIIEAQQIATQARQHKTVQVKCDSCGAPVILTGGAGRCDSCGINLRYDDGTG